MVYFAGGDDYHFNVSYSGGKTRSRKKIPCMETTICKLIPRPTQHTLDLYAITYLQSMQLGFR